MSLNVSQWRNFSDDNDVSGLYDGPHGDQVGAMQMGSMQPGCMEDADIYEEIS